MRISTILADKGKWAAEDNLVFIVGLSRDLSKYTDEDWVALIRHMKCQDGSGVSWETTRYGNLDVSDLPDGCSVTSDGVSISCNSLTSNLTTSTLRSFIQERTDEGRQA